MQITFLKKLTNSAFILGAFYIGATNFSPVLAQDSCDASKATSYCLTPFQEKTSKCGPDSDCANRWRMAKDKCLCDIGCNSMATSCEQAQTFCEGDISSNRCDDLHRPIL